MGFSDRVPEKNIWHVDYLSSRHLQIDVKDISIEILSPFFMRS